MPSAGGPRINIVVAVVIILAIVGVWALMRSGYLPFEIQTK